MSQNARGSRQRARVALASAATIAALAATTLVAAPAHAEPIDYNACTFPGDGTSGIEATFPSSTGAYSNGVRSSWAVNGDGSIYSAGGRDTAAGQTLELTQHMNWGRFDGSSDGSTGYGNPLDWSCIKSETLPNGDVVQRTKDSQSFNSNPLRITTETRLFKDGDVARRSYTVTNISNTALGAEHVAQIGHGLGSGVDAYKFAQNPDAMITTDVSGDGTMFTQLWGGTIDTETTGGLDIRAVEASMGESAKAAEAALDELGDMPAEYFDGISGTPINWGGTGTHEYREDAYSAGVSVDYSIAGLEPGESATIVEFLIPSYFERPAWVDGSIDAANVAIPYTDGYEGPAGGDWSYEIMRGEFPTEFSFDENTAKISGTGKAEGHTPFVIWAKDGDVIHGMEQNLNVDMPPWVDEKITGSPITGTAFSDAVKAPAIPDATYLYTATEGLAPGLTLSKTTGEITGTPTQAGRFTLKVQAVYLDFIFTTSISYTVRLAPPVFTDAAFADAYVGVAYSDSVAASGATGYYVTGGTAPDGLTFTSSGTLTGTPTTKGSSLLKVWASNTAGEVPANVGIAVYDTAWKNGTVGTLRKGQPVDVLLNGPERTAGTWTYSLKNGSTVPAGVTFSANQGIVSGTPTETGNYSFTVVATDGVNTFEQLFEGRVHAPLPNWSDSTLADGKMGVPYSDAVSASGATSYEVKTGTLPRGLVLGTDGKLTGTPLESGSFDVVITASNADGDKELPLTLSIAENAWVDEALAPARVGTIYNDGVTAPKIDGIVWAYAISEGELPDGLELDPATGKITGTPESADFFWFEVEAVSGDLVFRTDFYSTVSNPLPVWTDAETVKGRVGLDYSDQVAADHAVEYEVVGGSLPDGLELDADGAITGVPTKAGSFTYTVAAYNEGVGQRSRTSAPVKGDSVEHEVTTVILGPELGLKLDFAAGAAVSDSTTSISASGLKVGSEWTLVMHSDPVVLATGTVDETGAFAQKVALPAGTPAGSHELLLTGISTDGSTMTAKAWFAVDEKGTVTAVSYTGPIVSVVAALSGLASTGFSGGWLVLPMLIVLMLGALLLFSARRRRGTDGAA